MRDHEGSVGSTATVVADSFISGSMRGSLGCRIQYSGDSYDIARCHRQFEVLIDTPHSPEHRLTDTAYGLGPAEVLLDALWLKAYPRWRVVRASMVLLPKVRLS
jgi:hypothetical protein